MRRALAIGGLAALGILSGFGCGGGDTGSTGSGGSGNGGGANGGGGAGGGPEQVACTGQPSETNLSGIWAARGTLAVTLKGQPGGAITICPADQVGESELLLMLDIQANASDPTKLDSVKATLCSINLPTVTALVGDCTKNASNLLTTTLKAPPAFLAGLPAIATQPVGGTLSNSKAGAALSLDRFTVDVGTSKSGASLPSWKVGDVSCNQMGIGETKDCDTMCVDDCAGLRDDDHDGYPGVTLQVCGVTASDMQTGVACNANTPDKPGATLQGKAYLDIQVDPQFSGTAVSSCEITGQVDTSVLYKLVGADVYLAGSPISVSSAIKSLPDFNVEVAQSKFRMVRVDGKYATEDFKLDPSNPSAACATIITNVNKL